METKLGTKCEEGNQLHPFATKSDMGLRQFLPLLQNYTA